MWFAAALCALAVARADTTLASVAPGAPIVVIRIERHDVFDLDDPSTSARAYRWVDAVHALTRESFIRSLLLFHEGDALDPLRLAESELILRGTGFLNPVIISAHAIPGGAEVVVETHDQWTIGLDLSFDVSGNRARAGGSLSDDNLLGSGQSVLVESDSGPERTSRKVAYADRAILGSRWQVDLSGTMSTDGSERFLRLEYPFFALATPRAGGIVWYENTEQGHLWASAERSVSGSAERRDLEVWMGFRVPGEGVRTDRILVGAFGERALFGRWRRADGALFERPSDRNLAGPEIGWEHATFRWKVVNGFRSWVRQEDLPLGPNWQIKAGLSLPGAGGDRARGRYSGTFDVGRWRERTYMWAAAAISGRIEGGNSADAIAHFELGGAMTGVTGLRLRVAADLGHALDRDRQLTLGADSGLRGYDPNKFDGTSRAVANVEWRHRITGELLHIAVLGMTLFADAGRTWGARVGPSSAGWRSDAGAGVLVEITRASVVRILRLEVAFPDRGGKPVVQVTSKSLF